MDDLAAPVVHVLPDTSAVSRAVIYVGDPESEGVIRQALSDLALSDTVFRPGGIAAAKAARSEGASPRLLIVDIGDVHDPAADVAELIGMCDPTTSVVVIGKNNDIRLYRTLKQCGAAEYFFKPLVTALMSDALGEILRDTGGAYHDQRDMGSRQGRLVLVVGARGGVGATTIAVRTAWRLAENPPRAVVLIDLDLQFGDAVLQLDATPNHALREALARADRVDDLFLERGMIHVTKRLDLLASMEPLEAPIDFEESAFLSLLGILRQRYRYIVVDLPTPSAIAMPRLLREPSLLILVSDEGLASAREVARLRQLRGANSPEHTIVHVLNKSGGPGSLPLTEFERGAGRTPDVIIPWSRDIATAANLGVKTRPECPVLDDALAPVFSRLTGEKPLARRSFLSKLLG